MKSYTLKYFCIGLMLVAMGGVSASAQKADAKAGAAPVQTATPLPSAAAAPGATPLPSDTALIGDLVDDPASKAVLDKDIPGLTTNSHINYLRSRTLSEVQVLANGKITDEQIAQTNKDLMALPKKADAPPATPPQ